MFMSCSARLREGIVRIMSVISLVFLILGCEGGSMGSRDYDQDYHLDGESFDAEWLKLVENKTGIALPEGSKGLHLFYKGNAVDPSFYAKIEIPEHSNKQMSDQIQKLPNSMSSVTDNTAKSLSWWKPTQGTIGVKRLMSGLQVFLSKEEGKTVLYVSWWIM